MIYTIKNNFLTVTAAARGAELQSLLGADNTQYLWQGDPKYWKGRAYNIFPFVARLPEGRYSLDGEVHKMAIHGIARYRDFRQTENTGTRLVLELRWDDETYEIYPRKFIFRVIYELCDSLLEITYEVENLDHRKMYFGLGGHPGFNVPMEEGLSFEDYRLRFSGKCSPEQVLFTPECLVSGETLPCPLENGDTIPLRHDLFDNDALVLRNVCREVTIESKSGRRSVTVSFPQMPNVGFWHKPGTDAPYVCVEPWLSLPGRVGGLNVFEDMPDLVSLAPGGTYRNKWSIRING